MNISKKPGRLDEDHSADDCNDKAEQNARVISDISGTAEEGRDLSSRGVVCAIAAIVARSHGSYSSSTGSAGGADFVAASTAGGD
jgi:hypothetical protein